MKILFFNWWRKKYQSKGIKNDIIIFEFRLIFKRTKFELDLTVLNLAVWVI